MSKSHRAPSPSPAPAGGGSLTPFIAIGLLGILIGATATYLVLAPRLRTPASVSATPGSTTPTAPPLPGPELTAGQSPAQSDRTLGNFHYDHQDWMQAIKHYESAIRQGSDDSDIRTDLGNAYRFSGRRDDALAQYQLAQRMNPKHEFSLFNQGGLYLQDFGDQAKALEIWESYLQKFPQGRNVDAARQLIAQTRGSMNLPASAAQPIQPPPAAGSATESLILQQIQAGQKTTPKP